MHVKGVPSESTSSSLVPRKGSNLDFSALQKALQLPLLPAHIEREHLERLHQRGEIEAAQTLVLHNLRFVVQIARQFQGYGLPTADLIQEGIIGLLKAIRSYKLCFEVKLITFANYWIKSEMFNYVLKHWRIVRPATTKQQRKLFFKLRQTELKLPSKTEAYFESAHGIAPEQVASMREKLQFKEIPLLAGEQLPHPESSISPVLLEDKRSNFAHHLEEEEWQNWMKSCLAEALQSLDERSADIIRMRFQSTPPKSLREISEIYQISIERTRQIEKKSLNHLKKRMAQLTASKHPPLRSKRPLLANGA